MCTLFSFTCVGYFCSLIDKLPDFRVALFFKNTRRQIGRWQHCSFTFAIRCFFSHFFVIGFVISSPVSSCVPYVNKPFVCPLYQSAQLWKHIEHVCVNIKLNISFQWSNQNLLWFVEGSSGYCLDKICWLLMIMIMI